MPLQDNADYLPQNLSSLACGLVTSETRFIRKFIVIKGKSRRNQVSSYLLVSNETVATY